jgi:hypothetical protein
MNDVESVESHVEVVDHFTICLKTEASDRPPSMEMAGRKSSSIHTVFKKVVRQ